MTNETRTSISRRHFLAASVATLAAPMLIRPASAQSGKRIVLPTYGGIYQEMIQKAFTEPFTQETGIEVLFSGVPDFARLKAQVQTRNVEWDVFEAGGSWFPAGSKIGLFEPLDASVTEDAGLILGANRDYVPFYSWASGIAFNGKKHKPETAPKDWAEFWDTERFPGRRTLRNRADMCLEIALAASGVDPAQLYPLDVDRAFEALERIKPSVAKWAESTSQLVTLLTTDEVDFGYNNNGRVMATAGSDTPLGMSLEQTIIGHEYMGVVKGSPRKEDAMTFVAFVLRPERQAAFANLMGYMPGNPKGTELVNEDVKKWLPDLSTGRHIIQNDDWWAENTEEMQQRFQEFLLL